MTKNFPSVPTNPPIRSEQQVATSISKRLAIRVITHNIRYATEAPFKGEELWPKRRPLLLNELRYHTRHVPASFICLQEVLHEQLQDILLDLNGPSYQPQTDSTTWSHIGTGRDDGHQGGEYNPILFESSTWQLLHSEQLWLSPTPGKPSRGWDAGCNRILVIGRFRHRATSVEVTVLNTHLDNAGNVAREKGAEMILKYVSETLPRKENVVLAGDFNSPPTSLAYQILNSDASPLVDLHTLVPRARRYGHEMTFTGFGYEKDDPPARIDFLFLGKTRWVAEGYAVLESKFDDGIYVSDHRAVVGDITLS